MTFGDEAEGATASVTGAGAGAGESGGARTGRGAGAGAAILSGRRKYIEAGPSLIGVRDSSLSTHIDHSKAKAEAWKQYTPHHVR